MKQIAKSIRPILALIPGGILVAVCYFFVDRPVAEFLHCHRPLPDSMHDWPPRISDWCTSLVIAAIFAIAAWRMWRPGGRLQTLLVALAANLVATFAIKSFLKWAFGRSWPGTWDANIHSMISNPIYGFHPFHSGGVYQSFPSGHAAAAFAVISILWLSRPRWRWLYGLAAGALCAALVGLNYHFVGDVIAGAMLGSITGFYTTQMFGLRTENIE
jgi:membrane-associated phospholipid phosphatase